MSEQKLSKFLIDANDERYWLYNLTDGGETVHQLTWPEGKYETNEISDTLYVKGTEVPYHEHRRGVEVFLIGGGDVEATIRGRRTLVHPGDMLVIQPYVGHGFVYLADNLLWRECFQEINMSGGIANKCRIKENYGDELYFEPEFRARYLAQNQGVSREPPVPVDVPQSEVPELRPHDGGLATFTFGNVVMRQKVGRWETRGVKEVWQILMPKGVQVEWGDPYGSSEVYLVNKGSIRWKVLDEEFVAGHDCFVKIPPYAKHSFEVLEDDTELIDFGCTALMNDMLEDYNSIMHHDPSRLADPADLKAFLRKYNCFVTNCAIQ
ncbi:MAG: hypothetical protein VB099_13545 [Candidatus Limiplasma sp.]|nr:hypothetical protein [Candidatus Limiplasma sp.]